MRHSHEGATARPYHYAHKGKTTCCYYHLRLTARVLSNKPPFKPTIQNPTPPDPLFSHLPQLPPPSLLPFPPSSFPPSPSPSSSFSSSSVLVYRDPRLPIATMSLISSNKKLSLREQQIRQYTTPSRCLPCFVFNTHHFVIPLL